MGAGSGAGHTSSCPSISCPAYSGGCSSSGSRRAYAAGRLRFSGTLDGLSQAHAFTEAIRQLRRKNWIVYAQPPFGSPEQVLAYLSRYTHRVAIANSRLVAPTRPA
ncbi:transposase [Mesorhizobium sp. M0644]